MPTYGYRCTACETEFDVVQRMTDEAGAACPQCGAPGKRLFFPAGIVFRGSGFYKTDSRNGSSGSSIAPATGTPKDPGTKTTPETKEAPAPASPPAAASESPASTPASPPSDSSSSKGSKK